MQGLNGQDFFYFLEKQREGEGTVLSVHWSPPPQAAQLGPEPGLGPGAGAGAGAGAGSRGWAACLGAGYTLSGRPLLLSQVC